MARNRTRIRPTFTRRSRPVDLEKILRSALLPVLACFLGGATEKWSEGIVVALLGFILLVNPPRLSLGWAFWLCPVRRRGW